MASRTVHKDMISGISKQGIYVLSHDCSSLRPVLKRNSWVHVVPP